MMIRVFLTASLCAMPIAASAQAQSFTGEWDGRPAARGDALLKAAMLDVHNRARAAFGSVPLVWNDALARDALGFAGTLARENRFAHDPQRGVKVRQGENLWMGTRGAFTYPAMADSWIDERKDYRPGKFPQVSRTGDWSVVGHYTQAVWPTTTTVGCAVASNADDDFLVCRYLSAGNVMGVDLRPTLPSTPKISAPNSSARPSMAKRKP